MLKIHQKNSENEELEAVAVSDRVFGDRKRKQTVYEMVRFQTAKRHLGTHRAKTRSFISRSSAKPYPQKGTGRARRGDSRSPLLKGGGVIFPPTPRSYEFSLPKKVRKAALRSVLSDKLANERVMVLAEHGLKSIKTQGAKELMTRLGLKKALVVVPAKDEVLEKSMRNLPGYKVLRVPGVNVFDLLHFEHLVILKEALPLLEKRLN